MLRLLVDTDPDWIGIALTDLDQILVDHAHLEKKAASHAFGVLFKHPEQVTLQRPLARLACEELGHFELVLDHLERRGGKLERIKPAAYAGRLRAIERGEPHRLIDSLLMASVIEARSCERMKILSEHVPDQALAKMYRGLLASEARHHQLYVDLAISIFGESRAMSRLAEILEHEAKIIGKAPREPRIHG
ncbi:MAG: tRNA-(ms[2]io[6]A)-hydroxylase [Deltaproteobacteria bacterium]|nr:tRNA-(ms[2]io[6]A)-hydroxylase [Deltaproteobacteria bacterium]